MLTEREYKGDTALHGREMKAQMQTHPVDHTPSMTAPGVVVDIILEAIRDVSQDAQ